MAKKGNLFSLIKSLSKSEKRYFRIYAGMGGRDANYLRLFDAIDAQAEYDEATVREKLEGERFLSQLHVTKIYLTELILKALKNYHADASVYSRLLDLLRDIELLYDKELYDLCHYKIVKAEEIAARYEKLALLVEVYGWKRKLALAVSGSRDGVLEGLRKEKYAIGQMETLNRYWDHTLTMGKLATDASFNPESLAGETGVAPVLQSRVLHHHIAYGLCFLKQDLAGAEREISDLIALLEQFPDRISEDPHPYVTALSNKIGLYLITRNWDAIPALIRTIREVPLRYRLENESKFTVRLWLRTFNVELEMYRDSRQFDAGVALMEEIQQFIEKHRKAIPDDYILLFYYQFANIFFLKKAYKKSLGWVNEIINANYGSAREDIQAYARILNLALHFELDNIVVLRYAVDSCRRFLKKRRIEIRSGKEILGLFSKLSQAYPEEYEGIFRKGYTVLFATGSDQGQDYFDLKGWLGEKFRLENSVDD